MRRARKWAALAIALTFTGLALVTPASAEPSSTAAAARKCEEVKTGDPLAVSYVGTTIPVIKPPWFKGEMVPGSMLKACSGVWKPRGNTHLFAWYSVNPDGTGRKKVGGDDRTTYVLEKGVRCVQLVITATHGGYYETPTPSAIRCVRP